VAGALHVVEVLVLALHQRGLARLDSRGREPLVHVGEQPGEGAAARARDATEGVARAQEGPVDGQAERGVQLRPLRLQALLGGAFLLAQRVERAHRRRQRGGLEDQRAGHARPRGARRRPAARHRGHERLGARGERRLQRGERGGERRRAPRVDEVLEPEGPHEARPARHALAPEHRGRARAARRGRERPQ